MTELTKEQRKHYQDLERDLDHYLHWDKQLTEIRNALLLRLDQRTYHGGMNPNVVRYEDGYQDAVNDFLQLAKQTIRR